MSDNRTTELREKLTERGVKWWPMRNNGYYEERDTEFVANGKKHIAHEWGDGLAIYNLTPEQAIAATLGKPEIVRCRDCKHGHEVYWPANFGIPSDYLDCTGPLVTTWDEYHDVPKDNPVRPDGFCAWGERRDE